MMRVSSASLCVYSSVPGHCLMNLSYSLVMSFSSLSFICLCFYVCLCCLEQIYLSAYIIGNVFLVIVLRLSAVRLAVVSVCHLPLWLSLCPRYRPYEDLVLRVSHLLVSRHLQTLW